MRLWVMLLIVFGLMGVLFGYTFSELNKFNSSVKMVLAP